MDTPLKKTNYEHRDAAFFIGEGPTSDSLEDLNTYIPELISKVNNEGNRNLVINSALIVEFLINNLLEILLPKYSRLDENTNLTFSLKIELLRSFNIINPNILMRANVIREIRNEYAHNIECSSINNLNEKSQSKVTTGYYSIDKDLIENKMPKEMDLDKQFRQLFLSLVINLKALESNIRIYRKVLDSEMFKSEYKKEVKSGFQSKMKE